MSLTNHFIKCHCSWLWRLVLFLIPAHLLWTPIFLKGRIRDPVVHCFSTSPSRSLILKWDAFLQKHQIVPEVLRKQVHSAPDSCCFSHFPWQRLEIWKLSYLQADILGKHPVLWPKLDELGEHCVSYGLREKSQVSYFSQLPEPKSTMIFYHLSHQV